MIKIEKLLNKNLNIFSHRNKLRKEHLIEHIYKTKEYLDKIIHKKNLKDILLNLIGLIENDNKDMVLEMFESAIMYHDIGKINPSFQHSKMGNTYDFHKNTSKFNDSRHSEYSSYIYLRYYLDKIDKNYTIGKNKLNYICYAFSYIISKHHSFLEDDFLNKNDLGLNFIERIDDLDKKLKTIDYYYIKPLENLPEYKKPIKITPFKDNEIEFYILCKLLYSLLISSDYYATYSFMEQSEIDNLGLFDDKLKNEFSNKLEKNNIIKNIRNGNNSIPINALRSEIFIESENSLLNEIDKNIFYLESPTGSGKTINSINLAIKLLKLENINKIFYVFPFNTLSEQTFGSLENIFGDLSNNISIINSISPIKENKEKNDIENYMDRLFFNYPLNILSHVGFFNILFGLNKTNNFPLFSLCNSVIILDEIQTYNIGVWKEFINMLQKYADILNIKVIIMSATLPKLDILLKEDYKIVNLIKNPMHYFNNDIFKNRVNLDFSLLEYPKTLEDMKEFLHKKINTCNKIIIEFQTKKHTRDFYNLISDKYSDYEIYEVTGDDNILYRNYVIERTKVEGIKMIIVSTAVLEAGADIDMDLGIKEISILENEEQFIGRINRSCLKNGCKVYFFNLEDSKTRFIYENDIRFKYNLKDKNMQKVLIEKNFNNYYNKCLYIINKQKNKLNTDNYNNFLTNVSYLNFLYIFEKMKLINSNTQTIFVPHTKIERLNGYEVWNNFINLLTNKEVPFAKKKIELSKLYNKMAYFSFNIYIDEDKLIKKVETADIEFCSGYYYIKNGDNFITNEGKLDRDLLDFYLS